jgi:hypothetical protein
MTKKTVKKVVKKKTEYSVEVSYNAKFYFDFDINDPKSPEKVIPKYLKKHVGGSGCGFGRRDLVFYFRSRKSAEAVTGLIAKASFKKKWEVEVSKVYPEVEI